MNQRFLLTSWVFYYFKIQARTLFFIIGRTPRLVFHALNYYISGPPRKSWPLTFHLTMKTIKSLLTSYNATNINDIAIVQRISVIPIHSPPTCVYKCLNVRTNPKAIDFFKTIKLSTKLPQCALETSDISCEWTDSGVDTDRVVLFLHGVNLYIKNREPM
jgi:hypothetical protein